MIETTDNGKVFEARVLHDNVEGGVVTIPVNYIGKSKTLVTKVVTDRANTVQAYLDCLSYRVKVKDIPTEALRNIL